MRFTDEHEALALRPTSIYTRLVTRPSSDHARGQRSSQPHNVHTRRKHRAPLGVPPSAPPHPAPTPVLAAVVYTRPRPQ
jgi:hypothetical protein